MVLNKLFVAFFKMISCNYYPVYGSVVFVKLFTLRGSISDCCVRKADFRENPEIRKTDG